MEILPAIDLLEGRCVRLVEGDFTKETAFSNDPVAMARRWEEEGARWLHVVDLDGARKGSPQNWEAIAQITRHIAIPIEVGGGVRTLEIADRLLGLRVARVVIGTSAALDAKLARSFFDRFGERVVLGLDARDGYVAVKGWQETVNKTAIEFAQEMAKLGTQRLIYTDIRRDGKLAGVNIEGVKAMAQAVSIPVIASGGVSSLDDIRQLKALEPLGVEGVIIGKALYTGAIKMTEALRLGAGSSAP